MGGEPEQMLAAELAGADEHLPGVVPGDSAIPPLHLAV
jgi:hypothetical protein